MGHVFAKVRASMPDRGASESRYSRMRSRALIFIFGGCTFLVGMLFASSINAHAAGPVGHRTYELMIYHARRGKAADLASVFSGVSKLQAKHGLGVVGYWLPSDPAWRDTLIYLIAQPSQAAAEAHWKELHDDPAFPPYRKAAARLIAQTAGGDYRVDEIYMRPTAYSAAK